MSDQSQPVSQEQKPVYTLQAGGHPIEMKYLVLPLDSATVLRVEKVVSEMEAIQRAVLLLTEAVARIAAEMERGNDIEGEKLKFSKMKDIMLAKLGRMMEKAKKEVESEPITPGKS